MGSIVINFESGRELTTLEVFSRSEQIVVEPDYVQVGRTIELKHSAGLERIEEILSGVVLLAMVRLEQAPAIHQLLQPKFTEARAAAQEILTKQVMNDSDPQAKFNLGLMYVARSLESRDPGMLDTAETWFRQAAASGYSKADEFLRDSWPRIKADHLKTIRESS